MPLKVGGVELNDDEVKDLKEVFDLVDTDRGGSISVPEIKQLTDLLGMKLGLEDIQQLMLEYDTDGSGEVDFLEFLKMMTGNQESSYTQKDVIRAFKIISDDKDAPPGHISAESLEKALVENVSHLASSDELMRLVSSMELTQDGWINYVEKVKSFMAK